MKEEEKLQRRDKGARRRTHYLRWLGYCFVIGMVVVKPVVDNLKIGNNKSYTKTLGNLFWSLSNFKCIQS